jgi:hypothetical protein
MFHFALYAPLKAFATHCWVAFAHAFLVGKILAALFTLAYVQMTGDVSGIRDWLVVLGLISLPALFTFPFAVAWSLQLKRRRSVGSPLPVLLVLVGYVLPLTGIVPMALPLITSAVFWLVYVGVWLDRLGSTFIHTVVRTWHLVVPIRPRSRV